MTAYGLKPLIAVHRPWPRPSSRRQALVPACRFWIANPLDGTRISYLSPQRGDIVLVSPPWVKPSSLYRKFAEFGHQVLSQPSRVGINADPLDRPVIKRIVALPGDTVQMEDFTVYVRTAGIRSFPDGIRGVRPLVRPAQVRSSGRLGKGHAAFRQDGCQ
jgi:type IV secretory pathway protease TraF